MDYTKQTKNQNQTKPTNQPEVQFLGSLHEVVYSSVELETLELPLWATGTKEIIAGWRKFSSLV